LCLLLLLLCLRDGLTGKAPDYEEAMRWYLKAAEGTNNAMAQNNIGRAYLAGEGVPKDAAAAARWYRKAADQGYGVAEFNLAVMLRNGAPGVPQDHAAALDLRKRQSSTELQRQRGCRWSWSQAVVLLLLRCGLWLNLGTLLAA
jgi:TPR repeat protein